MQVYIFYGFFEKTSFFLCVSVLSLNQEIKICVMCYVILFSPYIKKLTFYKNKLFIKVLQYYVKPCFQTYFEFFRKRKTVTVMKIKRVKKKIIRKKVSSESFSSMFKHSIRQLFLELSISISIRTALLLRRQRKIRTSFKTLVSKKTTIWRLKNLTVTTNFGKK